VPGIEVYGVRSLRQVLAILRGTEIPDEEPPRAEPRLMSESLARRIPEVDLSEVIGQKEGRRASRRRPRVGITSICTDLRAQARPCWPSGWPD